jgi:hypothetical protein
VPARVASTSVSTTERGIALPSSAASSVVSKLRARATNQSRCSVPL